MKKYELTQVQGKDVVIDISQLFREEVLYVNATKLAKQFGKSRQGVAQFFASDSFREYENTLFKVNEYIDFKTDRKGLKYSTKGKYGGTYLHSDLLVVFLRWLDPEFAVKCDLYIRKMIQEAHDEAVASKATIAANKKNLNWNIPRENGKGTRKAETSSIQDFCAYAQDQREEPYLNNKCPYYILLSNLPYKVLGVNKPKGSRDELSAPILAEVERIEGAILLLVAEVIADGEEYHEAYRKIVAGVRDAVQG